ncbi:MAG: MazG nucleotide pyrophosphohydrolase domain-containing protein [Chloroflexota bacterium]
MIQSNFQKIEDFQKAAGAKRPSSPTTPDLDILQFRLKLISEEFDEVKEAITQICEQAAGEQDQPLASLAHELADLLYVVYGTFSACGIDADAVFAEIHRANMTKMDGPRREDGKLLKPPGWQPADVASLIKRLGR